MANSVERGTEIKEYQKNRFAEVSRVVDAIKGLDESSFGWMVGTICWLVGIEFLRGSDMEADTVYGDALKHFWNVV